jgi:hypothetical protein
MFGLVVTVPSITAVRDLFKKSILLFNFWIKYDGFKMFLE